MSETLLETRDVACRFMVSAGLFRAARPLQAVNGVSLRLAKGEVLGLVGESGCGKSTLAKMLLGLQKPSGGDIVFDGEAIAGLDRIALARRIQPIFQDPYSSLNPRKTVGAIIALPLRVHGVGDAAQWRRRVEEMMDLVGLARRFHDLYPSQLSGGQRQPSALDVSVQSQILNLLQDLRAELGLTYLLISHNLAVVEHMATRVAVMYLGRIVEEAETATLFAAPRHPYTKALLASVLTPEPGLGLPDIGLGTSFPNPLEPPTGCAFHPRCPQAMAICRSAAPRAVVEDGGHVECHLYDAATTLQEAS